MAFRGRGEIPSLGHDPMEHDSNHNFDDRHRRHYRDDYYRNFYYIPLDNTYVMLQMIATFLILIIGAITYLATYQSAIVDPIADTKKLFLNSQLVSILLILMASFVANFFSKTEIKLVKKLLLIFAISMVTMVAIFGVKLQLDSKYTKTTFGQIYNQQNGNVSDTSKTRLDVSLTGIQMKTEKEFYVDECMKMYHIFQTKTYGILGLHLLLNGLLIFQIIKILNTREKKKKLDKDDLILFDEENVFDK